MIGGGPAGLFAAEILAAAGVRVTLYERMPSVGRKFLMAGRGGLNLTHSEPLDRFRERYAEAMPDLAPHIDTFPPDALRAWAEGLGQQTFVGSSGRVFPVALKASPLLRAWLARLTAQGVTIRTRSTWRGWTPDGTLAFETPSGPQHDHTDATILALGGASWPRLGADGTWAGPLQDAGVEIAAFKPANMGFHIGWSPVMKDFAGQPLKGIRIRFQDQLVHGEATVTRQGLEGGAIYALSGPLREKVMAHGQATIELDLRPHETPEALAQRLSAGRAGDTLSNRLRRALRLSPLEINLLREAHGKALATDPARLAGAIKRVPLRLVGMQPIARAISSAGGVRMDQMNANLMLTAKPGVFVAGEMMDWEAPTGGYLLQACFATGRAAALGVISWLTTVASDAISAHSK